MTNEKKCYKYFTEIMKLNCAGACGILANIRYESNFRPTAKGDGGTSYGICQWHNTRYANLKRYCSKNGYDYRTLEGQLHYLQYELEKSYKSVLNYIKKVSNDTKGAYNAGYKWCYDFERPAKKAQSSVKRGNYAKTYFKKYYVKPVITPTNEAVYVVKRGDTLTGIAKKYNTTYQKLAKYNNIDNPNVIRIGQKIKIPNKTVKPVVKTYKVKRGDTLTGIAKKYKTTVASLVKKNNIDNPNIIRVGQILKI